MFIIFQGVMNIASVSLEIGYPTLASVPHSIVNGLKNLIAIAVETDISFKEAEMVRLIFKGFSNLMFGVVKINTNLSH